MKKIILTSALLMCLIITAFPQTDNAIYLSQSMPGDMEPSVIYNVSVSVKNTGNTVWTTGSYSLRLVIPTDAISKTWSVNNVELIKNVNPGDMYTFYFRERAPLTEGGYNIQWQMSKGTVFFGEPTASVPIRVAGSTGQSDNPPIKKIQEGLKSDNAIFLSVSMPLDWDDNHVYDASIMVKNTGKSDWTQGDYRLRIIAQGSDKLPSSLTISYIDIPNKIYSGTESTIYFQILAPESNGVYNLKAQMVKNGVLFGEPSQELIINVH